MFTDLNEFLKAKGMQTDRRVYTYIRVRFSVGGYGYTYIAEDKVREGDIAVVNSKDGKRMTVVTEVTEGLKSEAPYDFAKLQTAAEIVPYGSERHMRLMGEMFANGNAYPDRDEDAPDEDDFPDEDYAE